MFHSSVFETSGESAPPHSRKPQDTTVDRPGSTAVWRRPLPPPPFLFIIHESAYYAELLTGSLSKPRVNKSEASG
jgi:hypothetical protein